MSYFPSLSQSVTIDTANTYSGAINTGATWNTSGTGTSTLGVNSIQVTVSADQNLIIYVDQGNANNAFQVTDQYNYDKSTPFGITTQAVGAFVRVRASNFSGTNATAVKIDTVLCPIADPLPRSLDSNQNLKVSSPTDEYGWEAENTPMGERRSIAPVRLVGKQFDFYGSGGLPDPNFFNTFTSNGGTATVAGSSVALTSGTNSVGTVVLASVRRGRYVSGSAMRYRASIRLGDTGTASNTRRWGVAWMCNYDFTVSVGTPAIGNVYSNNSQQFTVLYINGATVHCAGTGTPTASGTLTFVTGPSAGNLTYTAYAGTIEPMNGAWYELAGTTFSLVTAKDGVQTKVASGVFNGHLGGTYAPTATNTTYEIYWTNNKVYFAVGDKLLHTVNASTATWSSTPTLQFFADNINSGNTTSVTLNSRTMSIARLGLEDTSPRWYNQHGVQAGILLKTGGGRLKSVVVNSTNTAGSGFTIYDALSSAGPVIATAVTSANNQYVGTLTYNLDFYNGLFLVCPNIAANDVTVIYE